METAKYTKPTVGQVMFAVERPEWSVGEEKQLIPVTVVSVGRKYFETQFEDKIWTRFKFSLESREFASRDDSFSSGWIGTKIYDSPAEYLAEKTKVDQAEEFKKLWGELAKVFNGYHEHSKISLETLRQIRSMIP